jgi:serine/threonine protein kinase
MSVDRRPNDKADTRAINAEQTAVLAPVTPTTYLGALLKERYQIERELGRGGIGAIYLARDRQLMDKPVVIKVMLSELEVLAIPRIFQAEVSPGDQSAGAHRSSRHRRRVRCRRDARGQALLRHAVRRRPIAAVAINESGPKGMDFARVAELMRQIGHALSAAHDKGIHHRDLKPENIMLQDLGRGEELVKLIDFGMATVKDSQSAAHAEVTKVAGTLPYMAPEQLRGKPSALSDIFSSGVIAYEMVTGYLPFKSDSPVQQYELQRAGVAYLPVNCVLGCR